MGAMERPSVAEAYARAESAHDRIKDHEELCAERYRGILSAITDLKDEAKGQRGLLWGILLSVAGFTLVTLVAVVLKKTGLA